LAGLDPVLLATGGDDGVHGCTFVSRAVPRGQRPEAWHGEAGSGSYLGRRTCGPGGRSRAGATNRRGETCGDADGRPSVEGRLPVGGTAGKRCGSRAHRPVPSPALSRRQDPPVSDVPTTSTCALMTRAHGAELAGTAPVARGWLLVEQPG